ncbi:MAG: thermonuclease family protein [Acidobacteriota bacterium]|jgi:micrococcal nuclease|nr:MAG: nuclease [Acidobacteriota bacterium]
MSVRSRRVRLIVGLAFLLTAASAGAQQNVPEQVFPARVVLVEDGDTVQIAAGRGTMRVRIFGIDAPESGQAFGREAREIAARLLASQLVDVVIRDVDSYGRLVAELRQGDRNLGRELVAAGAAWHYTAYSDDATLARAEQEARAARRGLWAAANPVAPWDYRAVTRSAAPTAPAAAAGAAAPAATPRSAAPATTAVVYHGNRNSRVFHAPGCQHYNCPNCVVEFTSIEAAQRAGFRPHAACVRAR